MHKSALKWIYRRRFQTKKIAGKNGQQLRKLIFRPPLSLQTANCGQTVSKEYHVKHSAGEGIRSGTVLRRRTLIFSERHLLKPRPAEAS